MRELLFWTTLTVLSPLLLVGVILSFVSFGFRVGWELANEFHNYIAE